MVPEKVVPTFNLEVQRIEKTDETCITVVNVDGLQPDIVVDRISEVLKIEEENISPLLAFGAEAGFDFLSGIGKSEGYVTLLLNIEKILPSRNVYGISETE